MKKSIVIENQWFLWCQPRFNQPQTAVELGYHFFVSDYDYWGSIPLINKHLKNTVYESVTSGFAMFLPLISGDDFPVAARRWAKSPEARRVVELFNRMMLDEVRQAGGL